MVLGTLALSRATTEGLALWSRSDSSSKEMGGKASVGRCASRCANDRMQKFCDFVFSFRETGSKIQEVRVRMNKVWGV